MHNPSSSSEREDELFIFHDIVTNPELNPSNTSNTNAATEQEQEPQPEQPVKENFKEENVNLGQGEGEIVNNSNNSNNASSSAEQQQSEDDNKPENVSIAHITNYSFKRANYIAKQARDELIFVAFFKGTPKPIPGQKPNLKNMFEYRKFYYWPVLTEDWEQIRNLKNEISRLNEISNQKNGYTDVQGNFHPPSLRENDRSLTLLEDKEFYNLSHYISQKQDEMNKLVLLKAFGIEDQHIKGADSNSVKTAIDAAVYRLENGTVPESKNSVYS